MYKFVVILAFALLTSCFHNPANHPEEEIRLHQIWSFEHEIRGDAPPAVYKDKLFMSAGLFVYAINEETGEEIWRSQFDEDLELQGSIFLINGNQVVVAHIDKIRAWDTETGNLMWEFEYTEELKTRLIGRHISFRDQYGFISRGSRFFILNKSGTVENVIPLDKNYGVQGLAYYEGSIFAGQTNTIHGALTLGRITAVDATTGDSLWAYDTEYSGFTYAAPVVNNGVVYAGAAGNSDKDVFVALDAETGEVKWENAREDPLNWTHDFTIGPKHVFTAGSGKIYALNKSTGEVVWEYGWESSSFVNPVYLGGYIYHSNHGNIFILDAETGKLVHEEYGPEGGGYVWHLSVSEDKLFVQSSFKLVAYQPWHLREKCAGDLPSPRCFVP
jgi:outer membrane protein assembly factor BamB